MAIRVGEECDAHVNRRIRVGVGVHNAVDGEIEVGIIIEDGERDADNVDEFVGGKEGVELGKDKGSGGNLAQTLNPSTSESLAQQALNPSTSKSCFACVLVLLPTTCSHLDLRSIRVKRSVWEVKRRWSDVVEAEVRDRAVISGGSCHNAASELQMFMF
ncbi:hypothetical protein E2542_SST09696 [Spatholobus suberectus]|nr:hypothetical protein E2542_SST09696 [Spatholobus suberectus]